jgi:hypothetical protein
MKTKSILAGVLVAASLSLAACTSSSSEPEPVSLGPDRDQCLAGTWKVSGATLAESYSGLSMLPGASVSGEGENTVVFGEKLVITYGATVKVTAGAGPVDFTAVYSGRSESTDWKAKDGKLSATFSSSDAKVDLTGTVAGQPVSQQSLPLTGTIDPSKGNVTYTCSASGAAIQTTDSGLTAEWVLTKVS